MEEAEVIEQIKETNSEASETESPADGVTLGITAESTNDVEQKPTVSSAADDFKCEVIDEDAESDASGLFNSGYQPYSKYFTSPSGGNGVSSISSMRPAGKSFRKPKLFGEGSSVQSAAGLVSSNESPPTGNAQSRQSRTFKCSECGAVIKNNLNLEVHMRRHLAYKPFHCTECAYTGYDEPDIERHLSRSHVGSQKAKGKFQPTADLESLVSEMIQNCKALDSAGPSALEQWDEPQQDKLDYATPSACKDELIIDEDCGTDDLVVCGLCGDSFVQTPDAVIAHAKAHLLLDGHFCPFCTAANESGEVESSVVATFDCVNDLAEHMTETHSTEDSFDRLESYVESASRLLPTELMSLVENYFSTSGALGGVKDVPNLKCHCCGLLIPWKHSKLQDHAKEHRGYYPYRCNSCDSPFSCTEDLVEHSHRDHPDVLVVVKCRFDVHEEKSGELDEMYRKCFPMLSLQYLELVKPDERGSDFKGQTAVIQPEAPDSEDAISGADLMTNSVGVDRSSVQCRLCQSKMSKHLSSLISHAKVHLAYKPLKCDYCGFRHFAMSKMNRHTSRMHPSTPVKVSYHPVAHISSQIKEMIVKSFGDVVDLSAADFDKCIHEDEGAFLSGITSSTPLKSSVAAAQANSALRHIVFGSGNAASRLTTVSPSKNLSSYGMSSVSPSDSDSYGGSDAMGFGKKICQMCNALIANNPSSFENHACKHLDYKPFHCHYCQYQSYIRGKVTRHIQQVHHGLPVKITHHPLPGIKDKIANIKLQCFPFLSGTSAPPETTPNRTSTILQSAGVKGRSEQSGGDAKDFRLITDEAEPKSACQLCAAKVTSEYQSLSDHLQSHIVSKFYHCPVCTYQTPYLIRAKQHVLSAHPECKNPSKIICCPPDGLKGLETLRVKCFGNSIGITGNEDSQSPTPSDDSYAQCGNGSIPVESIEDSLGDSDSLNGFESQEVTEGQDNDVSIEILDESLDDNVALSKLIHAKPELNRADLIAKQLNNNNNNTNGKRNDHLVVSTKNLPLKLVYHPDRSQLHKPQSYPSLPTLQTSASSTSLSVSHNLSIVKKLVCKLCNNSIADNPKSVGIHVKNHLNYKPFRCPFCKYMSCEQSKARRHVEHVHSVSGDSVLVATDENIKDKISEMKGRCFPNLGHMAVGDMYGGVANGGDHNNDKDDIYGATKGGNKGGRLQLDQEDEDSLNPASAATARCCLCSQTVLVDSVNTHVRTHSVKVFNCSYCTEHFLTESLVSSHIRASHPGSALRGIRKEMPLEKNLSEYDEKFIAVKTRCFPQIVANEDDLDDEAIDANSMDSAGDVGDNRIIIRRSAEPGKIYCTLCDQTLSANNNSLDVHVKNHLNYKPHQCGYCDYRSCIVGKVKRHVDNVHRGSELKIISFNYNSNRMKEIFQELKVSCFPQAMGFSGGIDGKVQTRSGLIALLDDLREKLSAEIQTLALTNGMTEGMDLSDSAMDDSFGGKTDDDDDNDDNADDDGANDILIIADADSEVSRCEPTSMLSMTRLKCQMCGTLIADNPSSIGLHVRNHLDYKPFCCNMCQYRSCIQAKVKRHLRNVHKCTTDEMMTYRPVADIRQQVNEMKLKCFPKGGDQTEEIWRKSPTKSVGLGNGAAGRASNLSEDDSFDEKPLAESLESINAYLDTVLGPIDGDSDSRKADESPQPKRGVKRQLDADDTQMSVSCQICSEEVDNSEVAKSEHCSSKHLGEHEFKCTYCTFMSPIQSSVSRHVCLEHSSQPPRIARSSIKDRNSALERLMGEAFPPQSEPEPIVNNPDNTDEGVNGGDLMVTCQLCSAEVSAVQNEVAPHVEMHMKKPHFKCCHCFFIHSSNAVVKDHMRHEHNNRSAKIIYHPADPTGSEAVWKMKCFPEDDDLEMLEELGEELDDETGEESYAGGTTKIQSGDGPRYICQICQLPVSMYASSLYVHVKNHMNYKPYACDHCDYKSPVKSKVRRHIQNAHKGKAISISYSPTPGIDHEVMRWKRKCFPEVTSFATLTNEKIPCQKCQTDVADTPLSKSVHAKNHLDSKPYHCGYCSYKSCLRGETRRHVIRQHPGKSLNISFHESEVVDKKSVDDMIVQCFHDQPNNSGSKANMDNDMEMEMIDNLDIAPSGVSLNAVMNMASEKKSVAVESPSQQATSSVLPSSTRSLRSTSIKLGPAYREWYCCYCDFSSTSKYGVKQHSLACHAGNPVDVSDVAFKLRPAEVAN